MIVGVIKVGKVRQIKIMRKKYQTGMMPVAKPLL